MLRMGGVTKAFGATRALAGVDLEVQPGEVHALIGENGAGKSTLMKVLSGAYAPDEGVIELNGENFIPGNPLHARQAGIAMIYQELNLAPHLSVEENILLGVEPRHWGWVNRREMRKRARQTLETLNHGEIPLEVPAGSLSIANQQVVEIARACLGSARVIIMDEPTSSLTRVDVENLFSIIRKLRSDGVSVIYISHFLEECREIADRFTVLRDGRTTGSGDMQSADFGEIIRMMVGREVDDIFPRTSHELGKVVLEVKELSGETRPRSASFSLREGEILGIAGLVGAGRSETVRACFGLDRVKGGSVVVRGLDKTLGTPRSRLKDGIGLLSENRKEEGLMLNRDLAENLTLTNYTHFSRWGFINRIRQHEAAGQWLRKLEVKARRSSQPIEELSGGNQQKIAIGRLLHHEASILLLDEPTRGIDVVSKTYIYHLIGELAAQGKAVVFISSYLPELLGVCDTIGVMCRGEMTEVRPVADWTEHEILSVAIGQEV